MVIVLASRKGGSQKSTNCAALGLYFSNKLKKNVVIQDLDVKQQSSLMFIQMMNDDRISAFEKNKEYPKNTILLVDTGGHITDSELNKLYKQSDLLIVPTQISPTDIRASILTLKALEETKKARLLFSGIDNRTNEADEIPAIMDSLKKTHKLKVKNFKTTISRLVAYKKCIMDGSSAFNPKALSELKSLSKEILKNG